MLATTSSPAYHLAEVALPDTVRIGLVRVVSEVSEWQPHINPIGTTSIRRRTTLRKKGTR